eukprot:scaffold300447_cov33-Tisochrysis_lutea.AAC.3
MSACKGMLHLASLHLHAARPLQTLESSANSCSLWTATGSRVVGDYPHARDVAEWLHDDT